MGAAARGRAHESDFATCFRRRSFSGFYSVPVTGIQQRRVRGAEESLSQGLGWLDFCDKHRNDGEELPHKRPSH
ncbi:hypothetical protein CO664_17935 [Sinorhizobium sp. NG07B]|nr:hypothetical protein CO664_17935 [Sinorhizobium sp. NG07B]